MATFSERIKALRDQSGMTQQEVADKLNVTKQTISQYERGLRRPDIESLEAIADLYNVSADYLLGKTDITMQALTEEELKILRSKIIAKYYKYLCALNDDGLKKVEEYIADLNAKYFKEES